MGNGIMARSILFIVLGTFVCVVSSNYDDGVDQMEDGFKQVEQSQETEESIKVFGNFGRSRRDALSEASLKQRTKKRRQQRAKLVKNGQKKKTSKRPKKGKKAKSKKTRRRQQRKNKGRKTKNNQDYEKKKSSLKQAAESKPITKECLTNILTTIKLRTKGTNYKRQHDRIIKFEKTGKNKLTKKAQFTSVAEKLIEVGGGNKDELKCGSEGTSGAGAKSLKDAITELEACDGELATKCNTSSYSIPPSAEVEKCKTTFAEINTVLSECDKLNPESSTADKLCDCYNGNGGDAAKWKEFITEAKACKVLKSFNDKTTTLHKECTKAFKKCSSQKKDAPKLIFSCSQTTDALKKKAAAAKKNADAVKNAKEKSAKLAGSSRMSRAVSPPSSCAEVIKTNTELATEVKKGKTNRKVALLGKAIAATPDSVTCSAEEKSSLKKQVTVLDAIAKAIETFVKELKEAIKTATGSEPSDSELDNVDTSSTTKKAVLRRDKIVKDLLARM